MTLPEHAICSVLLAQFGIRQRYGTKGVIVLTVAGIAPDLDSAVKLVADEHFWELHHALGHGLIPITVLAVAIALVARWSLGLRPFTVVFAWCALAGCIHTLTDALYWWGVEFFWPLSGWQMCFGVLEYLDLLLLSLWLAAAVCLYRRPQRGPRTASWTFGLFVAYVSLRAVCPPPTGLLRLITGGWMYEPAQGTPILDWW